MMAGLNMELSGAIPAIGSCRAGRETVFRSGFSTNFPNVQRATGKPLSSPDERGVGAGCYPCSAAFRFLSSPDEHGVGAGAAPVGQSFAVLSSQDDNTKGETIRESNLTNPAMQTGPFVHFSEWIIGELPSFFEACGKPPAFAIGNDGECRCEGAFRDMVRPAFAIENQN